MCSDPADRRKDGGGAEYADDDEDTVGVLEGGQFTVHTHNTLGGIALKTHWSNNLQ